LSAQNTGVRMFEGVRVWLRLNTQEVAPKRAPLSARPHSGCANAQSAQKRCALCLNDTHECTKEMRLVPNSKAHVIVCWARFCLWPRFL